VRIFQFFDHKVQVIPSIVRKQARVERQCDLCDVTLRPIEIEVLGVSYQWTLPNDQLDRLFVAMFGTSLMTQLKTLANVIVSAPTCSSEASAKSMIIIIDGVLFDMFAHFGSYFMHCMLSIRRSASGRQPLSACTRFRTGSRITAMSVSL
jgi:hypothetical protein